MVTTIKGTANGDNLTGTTGDDTIYGYDGNDTLAGGAGNDWLIGGNGDDVLIGGTGVNDYWGDAGNDTFAMSLRDATGSNDDLVHDFATGDKLDVSKWGVSSLEQVQQLLYVDSHGDAAFNAFYDGLDHVLRLEGVNPSDLKASDFIFSTATTVQAATAQDDVIFGTTGNDTIDGGAGDDQLLGGGGNDVLIGKTGLDNYDGGAGFDRVSYAYSNEQVDVNLTTGVATFGDGAKEYLVSIEAVSGSQADNIITGSAVNNELDGKAGNDTLKGQGGDDQLTGGLGADTLTGGPGNDSFVYRALTDSTPDASGRDLITDFTTGDHMDLTALEASVGESFHFVGTAGFSHTAGEIRYQVTSNGHTVVSLDSNGDGVADFAIQLTGSHTLTAADFTL